MGLLACDGGKVDSTGPEGSGGAAAPVEPRRGGRRQRQSAAGARRDNRHRRSNRVPDAARAAGRRRRRRAAGPGTGGTTGTGGRATGGTTGAGGARDAGADTARSPPITIWIAGDSTVATGSAPCPIGWGGLFKPFFNNQVTVTNSAIAGRSVRTWLYFPELTMDATGECILPLDASGNPQIQRAGKQC